MLFNYCSAYNFTRFCLHISLDSSEGSYSSLACCQMCLWVHVYHNLLNHLHFPLWRETVFISDFLLFHPTRYVYNSEARFFFFNSLHKIFYHIVFISSSFFFKFWGKKKISILSFAVSVSSCIKFSRMLDLLSSLE